MKTSLIVTATDSLGKTKQKTISDINPNATNEQIVALTSAMINTLTNSTYNGTSRVDKIDCDTETSKIVPTFTLNKTSVTYPSDFEISAGVAKLTLTVTYNGDAGIGVTSSFPYEDYSCEKGSNNQYTVKIRWNDDNFSSTNFTVVLRAAETNTYKAASATLTVNV